MGERGGDIMGGEGGRGGGGVYIRGAKLRWAKPRTFFLGLATLGGMHKNKEV